MKFFVRIRPGAEVIPARASRRLRVGRNHLEAWLHEVIPILDVLGIALAHQEDNRRSIRRTVVRQPLAPIRGYLSRLFDNGVDVGLERQRHDVGFDAVDNGAGLRAGAAMRLTNGDCLAGLRLPILDEGGVVGAIKLTSRVIGNVQ
jgi:hypothetical protein